MNLLRFSGQVLLATVVSVLGSASVYPEILTQQFPHVLNPPSTSDLLSMPSDLRAIPIPEPAGLRKFVRDRKAAIRLGKALFWDMQVGSDRIQACASCHFRAGADPRSKNQLNPGSKSFPKPEHIFSSETGPNYQLLTIHFPFRRLVDPTDRTSAPIYDNNDVVSSQGVHFLKLGTDARFVPDTNGFSVGTSNTRQVEPRNTPSVINSVFNHRNFWDGRAENIFNGVNHVGMRDPEAKVVRALRPDEPVEVFVRLENSSLASQAVAPIVTLEQAAFGRTRLEVGRELARKQVRSMHKKGKRLSQVRPLAKQKVHPRDSVLGSLSRDPLPGLDVESYNDMIEAAFHREWWDTDMIIRVASDGAVSFVDDVLADGAEYYSLFEYNFTLFLGIAIQMYETTLVSDDTPWDRFRRENPTPSDPDLNPYTNTSPNHISRLALFGANLFNDRMRGPTNIRCSNCHEQAELTDASVSRVAAAANGPVRNRDGNVIDKGFNNIGVRPTTEDLGVGATDAFGPVSHTRQLFPDVPPTTFDGAPVTKGFGVQGAFKIPSLRNVALTAPYFHNGGALTLRQVVEFYSRGGDLAPLAELDGTPIEPLGVPVLNEEEIDALVAFLETLTDERVLYRKAPFDHPQLFVPNGHPGDQNLVTENGMGLATDELFEIPAVGADGGPPLPGFLEGPFGPR